MTEELYDRVVNPLALTARLRRFVVSRRLEASLSMAAQERGASKAAHAPELIGKAAFIASVGGQRGYTNWTNPDHRLRRLLSEFLGMAGLTFILSGGAAILVRYGGHSLQPWQTVLVLSAVSALWLVVAVYFLGAYRHTSTQPRPWRSRCGETWTG